MEKPAKETRKALVILAVLISVVGLVYYWRVLAEDTPGDYHVRKGNYRLEDGQFEEALGEFALALRKNPGHKGAFLGIAVTYTRMGRLEEALQSFDRAIELDRDYAVAYADRGVANDRLGKYEEALRDYRKALELDPELGSGPGWLWRFMRNINEKPPTIRDRAEYLEAELKKPPEERVLSVPELDEKQRMYKK